MARKISKKNKNKKKLAKTKKLNCGPHKKNDGNPFTCYTSESLHKLKELWNMRHPDCPILSNNPKVIWETLKDKMVDTCEDEKCWLNQKFTENNLDPQLKTYTFAPFSPKSWENNPNEWLSSIDINKIMRQYERAHPSFNFVGPSPIDFHKKIGFGQCVWNDLCNFNLEKYLKKNKNKIGIIFNTDPHTSEGSHWICLFIDIKNNFIFFFDSNNGPIPKEIVKFLKNIRKQSENIGLGLEFYKNNTKHQRTDTECGMYVLYVIIQLLKEKMKPDDFQKRIPDEKVEKFRKIYFNQKN